MNSIVQVIRWIIGAGKPVRTASRSGAAGTHEQPASIKVESLSTLMSRPAAGGVAALGSGAAGAFLLGFSPLLLFVAKSAVAPAWDG